MSSSFVDSAVDQFYEADKHANCTTCNIIILKASPKCILCGMTFADAEKHWISKIQELKDKEDEAIDEAAAAKAAKGFKSKLKNWGKDWQDANVSKSVYDTFRDHVEQHEANPNWDASVLGGTTTEAAIHVFAPLYKKLKTGKTQLLDDVIRDRDHDPDDMIKAIVQYCKDQSIR